MFFYTGSERKKYIPKTEIENTLEKNLPKTNLLLSGVDELPDNNLRKGHVVLIFFSPSCDACKIEAEFLKDIVNRRPDVNFYGVTSKIAPGAFITTDQQSPFKVLLDREMLLTFSLGIRSVPFKVYVKDGVIKKFWRGATVDENKKKEFIDWLDSL